MGCRRRAPVAELLRVVARDGAVLPDPARRLPGRGAHLHPLVACLDLAERRKAFPRALRVPPPLTTDLVRRSPHGEELIRGEPARWSRHDPRPCLMPPDGPYRPIFAAQQREG